MGNAIQIKKVSPWMERLADELILDPTQGNAALAKKFGFTEPWISSVKNSDMFQDYFRQRSEDYSRGLLVTVQDKARATAELAIGKIFDKVQKEALPLGDLLDVADVMMKRSGYASDKNSPAPVVNQNFFGHVTKEDLGNARALMRGKLPQLGGPSPKAEEAQVIEETSSSTEAA